METLRELHQAYSRPLAEHAADEASSEDRAPKSKYVAHTYALETRCEAPYTWLVFLHLRPVLGRTSLKPALINASLMYPPLSLRSMP